MAAIIMISNREMSLAGCTRGLTRVEITQSERAQIASKWSMQSEG